MCVYLEYQLIHIGAVKGVCSSKDMDVNEDFDRGPGIGNMPVYLHNTNMSKTFMTNSHPMCVVWCRHHNLLVRTVNSESCGEEKREGEAVETSEWRCVAV